MNLRADGFYVRVSVTSRRRWAKSRLAGWGLGVFLSMVCATLAAVNAWIAMGLFGEWDKDPYYGSLGLFLIAVSANLTAASRALKGWMRTWGEVFP
jgi:hypothetical protein